MKVISTRKRSPDLRHLEVQQVNQQNPVAKKPRLSQELRSTRIREAEEDLRELDTRLRYLERAREKFATVKQYEHAAEKSKEIMSLRAEKRKFQAEMAQLQKSEVKSKK